MKLALVLITKGLVTHYIRLKKAHTKESSVEILKTNQEWIGIAYKTDKDLVEVKLEKTQDQGNYKKEAWKN